MNSPISRRRFAGLSLAASAALAVPSRSRAAAPQAKILDLKVISPQANYYHGWPTVARLKNGDLVLVWSGRREAHVCPFGTVEMMTSHDGGESWTFPRTLYDGPIDDRDAGVLETAKGTLVVTTFTSLAYVPLMQEGKGKADDATWLATHQRITDDEKRELELGQWCFRSTDGGLDFSARIDTIVNSPHGPCQLSDGRLLYVGKQLWTDDRKVGVCESRDDGLTWQWLADIPAREGDNATTGYHELHAVEAADGTIVAQIRNHNDTNRGWTLQTESADGGKTWSVPHPICYGLPSHLLRLRDDRLVMTYGHRREPFGNQARISEDNGKTWGEAIILSGDGIGGDLGYPSTAELDDGTLVTVWYELMAGSSTAQLRQARWKLA